jgi:CubicO group peptidase (beta-lactamase class C family)
LDDSIAKFLPDSVAGNPFIQKITFRSLANHTSGLPRLPDNLEAAPEFDPANPYATYGRAEMFAFLKSYKNEIEPGDQFEYSNLGYGLLGELISMVADQPYGQLVRDSIAVPLEMANTTQVLDPETQQLIAPHNSKGEEVAAWSFESMSGAGAFRSTVNDLLKYTLAQFVLPKNRLERAMMLTRQFSYFIPPNTDIGLAWHMNMVGDIIYYWHNGGTAGSSSFVALAPDKRTALVVLSNSSLSVDDISNSILQKVILAD